MKKIAIYAVASALILAFVLYVQITPSGRMVWNNWFDAIQKADDKSNYATRKKVEDTCRAMMASYKSDTLTYEQYIDSDIAEKQGWAEQAKMRANKTASTYNNYVLQNNYVWSGNVPDNINIELNYID